MPPANASLLPSTPSATHLPAAQQSFTSCRSCRGLLFYFPLHHGLSAAEQRRQSSLRSAEPTCLGISSAFKSGPTDQLDLKALQEARGVPEGQRVDFSMVLGHSVYQSSSTPAVQLLPPGCKTGLEVMRFDKTSEALTASTTAPSSSQANPSPQHTNGQSVDASGPDGNAAATAPSPAMRFMTSSAEINARFGKSWTSMTSFSPYAFANKFTAQANKNCDTMSKWLRDLHAAVTKPKA